MSEQTHESFHRKPWMTDNQWLCAEFLADLFHGFHHLHGILRECGPNGVEINSTSSANRFASFDFDYLTRAVFMAHARCIRFSIEPSGPGMLKLSAHQRHTRTGAMHERHPTIEDALARFSGVKQ
jgi:hypothetical protein